MNRRPTQALWLSCILSVVCGACADEPAKIKDMVDEVDMVDMSAEDQSKDLVADMSKDMSVQPCAQTLTWAAGRAIPAARDHHTSFITTGQNAAYLHVLGGTTYQNIFKDHWYAKIEEDGSLGMWQMASELPTNVSGNGVVQIGGHVYLLGGRGVQSMSDGVWRAKVKEDGTTSAWTMDTSLPNPRFHNSAAVTSDRVVVSGGLQSNGVAQKSMYDAEVLADGSLGPWRSRALTLPRSHHASFAHDGYLYLAMGFQGNPFNNATTDYTGVIRARLTDDPLQWEAYAASPHGLAAHASTVVGNCAYIFGGLWQDNGTYTYSNEVMLYDLNMPASVNAAPKSLTGFQTGRSHMHHVPFHNGRFYVIGGSKAFQDVVATVEIGTLTP